VGPRGRLTRYSATGYLHIGQVPMRVTIVLASRAQPITAHNVGLASVSAN